MKQCSKCKESKSLDEFYTKSKSKDGKSYWCISCSKNYHREYREKKREEIKDRQSRWYKENSERLRSKQKEYHLLNIDRYREHSQKRDAARVEGLTPEDLAMSQRWIEALKKLRFCSYCETRDADAYEIDHDIPVCRGGKDYWWNLVISCRDCNRSKGRRTGSEWVEVLRKRKLREWLSE